MIHLLELAAAILIHAPVAGQDVQGLQKFYGLARAYLWVRCCAWLGVLHGARSLTQGLIQPHLDLKSALHRMGVLAINNG